MEEQHKDFGIEYEFVREAFQKSTTFKAIQFRRGAALLAQDVVRDYDSPKLNKDLNHWRDHDQWILESWTLFNTSLSRMQYEALDIAVGLGHENAHYEQDTPSWAQGKFCNRYKFKLPKGYTNINIIATFGLMLLIGFVACLSIETGSDFSDDLKWKNPKEANQPSQMSEEELRSKQRFHGTWMVFDSAIWFVFHPSQIWPSTENAWRSLQTGIQDRKRPASRPEYQVPKPPASPSGSTSQAPSPLASSQAWSIPSSGTTASTGNSQPIASQTIGPGQSSNLAEPQAQASTQLPQVPGLSPFSSTPHSAQLDPSTASPPKPLRSPSP
jgi:hypothetical protein